jgi:hypothetical protein
MEDTITKLLQRHPRPWEAGEQHESMCKIVDANGKAVFTVETLGHFDNYAGDVADVILMAVNDIFSITKE